MDTLLDNPVKAKKVLGWEAKKTLQELGEIMLKADCKQLGINL